MLLTVDSSVFVAMFHAHEARDKHVRDMFVELRARGDRVAIPSLVVMETATALSRYGALAPISDFETYFSDFRILPLDEAFMRRFNAAARQEPLALKTSDAIMVRVAQWNGAALITLDRQMAAQGTQYVRTLTPQQYLDIDGNNHGTATH